MKKGILFFTIPAVLAIVSFYVFASPEQTRPKLTSVDILGPNSVPENTQNVYCVAAVYDDGSKLDVTLDANVKVVSDECKVINIGGIVETFKLEQPEKHFTIHANYHDFKVKKSVTIYSRTQKNSSK
jgi:hypothetical protein